MLLKILTLDIETTPNTVHRWQLYGNDTTGLNQLIEPSGLLCAAWKWKDDSRVQFARDDCVPRLHEALDVADVVVTYNGKKFDIPKLNVAFIENNLPPPSPFQHVDLYQTVSKVFGWPSAKLDYVAGRLLDEHKVKHTGHELWVRCMAGNEEAWKMMEEYNKGDVILTEKLLDILLPWIPSFPNMQLYNGLEGCPKCGGHKYQKRGFAVASTGRYQQYRCSGCRSWFRDVRRVEGAAVK